MQKQAISIIGAGTLGGTLARALHEAGNSIKGIYNRHPQAARKLAERISAGSSGAFPRSKSELGSLIFLPVADRAIEETARKLAGLANNFSGFTVVHCSGTKTSACLQPMRKKGAAAASFHPLQTFTRASTPTDFEGIYIDIEGDPSALAVLERLCDELNAHAMRVDAAAKPYLHAAAVMTSNYLVALMEGAGQIAGMGNIDEKRARTALMPLAKKSLKNIAEADDLNAVLSGPIARGDTATVAEHLKLLEQNPRLRALYKELGKGLLELVKKSDAKTEEIEKISRILNDR